MTLKKQWINCCWEERINNKEVSGNYENMETDNGKKAVQNMTMKRPIKWKMSLS